jgi:hypothetical protein
MNVLPRMQCPGGIEVGNRGIPVAKFLDMSGSSSVVERQLPKLDVAGSIPVSRSKVFGSSLLFRSHAVTAE